MPDPQDIQREFEARLEQRMLRHGRGQLLQDLRRSLEEYEQQLQSRLQAWEEGSRGAASRSVGAVAPWPAVSRRVDLQGAAALQEMDRLMWDSFGLAGLFPYRAFADYPLVYCETLEEYLVPLLETLDASESTRQEWLETLKRQAEEGARQGSGEMGYNLPGRGCFLNGWFLAYGRAASARAALADPTVFPSILATVAHERQGHGFLVIYTQLGAEKARLGLQRYEIARRFNLRRSDTPESALLGEKEGIVFYSSLLLEEGWATWIEQQMSSLAHQAGLTVQEPRLPSRGYTVARVGDLLQRLQAGRSDQAEAARAALDALAALFIRESPSDVLIHQAVRILQQAGPALDEAFGREFGQPSPYVLGYLLLQRLAGAVGPRCVPHAVGLAGNLSYGLQSISVSDLESVVAENPRLNADSRLALLGSLQLQRPGDVAELARLAREELNLAVPEGWPC